MTKAIGINHSSNFMHRYTEAAYPGGRWGKTAAIAAELGIKNSVAVKYTKGGMSYAASLRLLAVVESHLARVSDLQSLKADLIQWQKDFVVKHPAVLPENKGEWLKLKDWDGNGIMYRKVRSDPIYRAKLLKKKLAREASLRAQEEEFRERFANPVISRRKRVLVPPEISKKIGRPKKH